MKNIWEVVEADKLEIIFPTSHQQQLEIKNGFKYLSSAGFNHFAGFIDRLLIWNHKPNKTTVETTNVS
jgi:hypothetical protein